MLYILLFLALLVTPAQATCGDGASTCFVRTAGGTWTNTATWATSSGGASCTCTPAAGGGDSVVLDSNSGNLTVNTSPNIRNLDASGGSGGSGSPYINTVSQNANTTITVTGTLFKWSNMMFYSPANPATSAFAFTGTGVLAITSAGIPFGNTTINGVGGTFQPVDAFTINPTATLTLTNGTFDLATNNVNFTTGFIVLGVGTKTYKNGTGTVKIVGVSGTVIDMVTNNTGLTFSDLGIHQFNVTPTGTRQFNAGVLTWNNIQFVGCSVCGASRFDVQGGPTFTNMSLSTPPFWFEIAAGTTLTVVNAFALTGTASAPVQVSSDSTAGNAGAQATIHATVVSTIAWASIFSVIGNTAAINATNSLNLGNNGGTLNITPPSSGGGAGSVIIGGGL